MVTGCDVTLPDGLVLDLVEMMDEDLIGLARERGYQGIVTVNSHPVTIVREYTIELSRRLRENAYS